MCTDVSPYELKEEITGRNRMRWAATIMFLMLLCRITGVLPVFRDILLNYLNIGDKEYGLMFSMAFTGGTLAVLPCGLLIDRKGPVGVIRIALIGVACAFLVLAGAGKIWWVIAIGMTLSRLMVGPLSLAVNAFLVRLFPDHKRRIISLNAVAGSSGEILFPLLAEFLLSLSKRVKTITFAMVLHIPFLCCALVLLMGAAYFRPPDTTNHTSEKKARTLLAGFHFQSKTWALILLAVLHGTADMLLFYWWARFMSSEIYPEQPVPPGIFMSGYAIAYFCARFGLAMLPEQRWQRRLMVLPGLTGGTVLILGILSSNYFLTGISYVVGGFLVSAEFPTFLSQIAENEKERFGSAMAMQQMLTTALSACGMAGMGYLIQYIPESEMWQAMLIPATAFLFVGMGGLIWTRCFTSANNASLGSSAR